MFGAGWTEMLIIGVVALIVIGPKDLPVVMRKIGRVVGTVRRMGSEFQQELNKTTGLDQLTDLRRSITEPLRQTSEEIAREFNKVTSTGVEPSGVILPTDPKVESVYDQITAASAPATGPLTAMAPAPPPVMKPMAPMPSEPSPAPVEAIAPVAIPARPKRSAKAKAAADSAGKPARKAPAKSATTKTRAKAASAAPVPADAAAAPKSAAKPRARASAAKAAVAPAVASTDPTPATKPARSRAKKA